MVARRWMYVGAGALLVLWLSRGARAGMEPVSAPGTSPPTVEPRADPAAAKRPFIGYAAESARTATRLPTDEREARHFLRSAAAAARFEAEASRLAATRAQSAPVRDFAGDLFQYQEGAQLDLLHLLHARGMAPPMMDNAQRKALGRLARLSGARFDREYVELLGLRHQRQEVRYYERAVLGITDPALRSWIDRQLPSLRDQESAAARLGPGSPGRDSRRVEGLRTTSVAVQGPGVSAPSNR